MSGTVIRREPIEAFLPVERLFDTLFRQPVLTGLNAIEEGTLALDIADAGDAIVVRASLPGFQREGVSVEVHDGVLTISATREEVTEDQSEKFYRRERRMGSVSRRVALPAAVQEDQAAAELKDGVLTLRLPKVAEARPRRIAIN